MERCGKINSVNSASDNCTGIGVVAGLCAGMGIRYWPYLKRGDRVCWRSYLQILSKIRSIGKPRTPLRLWPGFPRHAVTIILAMSFLTCLELQHRHRHPNRGRPRDPFSPSARLASSCAASGTPGSGAVAASPSRIVVDHDGVVQGTVLTQNLT